MPARTKLTFHPLIPARWGDFETLFGERGACAGCWCMWWKLPRAEWTRSKGAKNRAAQRKIVMAGATPGLLAYDGAEPVGWCAVEPRENYLMLERSRSLKRIDDQPVWSITCFFTKKSHRRRGISVALLEAAAAHARKKRAKILEGYPTVVRQDKAPDVFIYTGTETAFRKAGFVVVATPSPSRRIMRRIL